MANFKKLIGLDIQEARKKIGYWWVGTGPYWPKYAFERSAGARLELTTNNENVVVQEWHNHMAEIYTKDEEY